MHSDVWSRGCGCAIVLFCVAVICCGSGHRTEAADPSAEHATGSKKVFLLPIEFDFDSGAANGDAIILRLVPTNTIPVAESWKLINIALVVVADAPGGVPGFPGNPDPAPGEQTFGLGDFTDILLYAPNKSKGLQWGVGGVFGFPTATDDVLGNGKWTAGPAVRLAHQGEHWHFGLVAGNLLSYAGDSDRGDVNQLLMRGLVRGTFNNGWFFIYSPIITANWNAASGQKWLVPVGGGVGKTFRVKSRPMNISLHVYGNVIKPDGAPDSVIRIGIGIPIWRVK